MDRPPARRIDFRLIAYVALGALVGAIYTLFDILSESRTRSGTLTGPLASAHEVIDRVAPVLVGALLGVCAHYFRLRAQLSAANQAAITRSLLLGQTSQRPALATIRDSLTI